MKNFFESTNAQVFMRWISRSKKKVVKRRLLSIVDDIRRQMDEPLSKMSVVILKDSMDLLLNALFEWDYCYYRNKLYMLPRDLEKSFETTKISQRIGMLLIDLTSRRLSRLTSRSNNIDAILSKVEAIV